jgi:hypothetical protein
MSLTLAQANTWSLATTLMVCVVLFATPDGLDAREAAFLAQAGQRRDQHVGDNGVIARWRLTQAAVAEKLGVNQPKVSGLANYKLNGFSVERLMTFLTALDQDVEIVIKNNPRSRTAGRISVIAA